MVENTDFHIPKNLFNPFMRIVAIVFYFYFIRDCPNTLHLPERNYKHKCLKNTVVMKYRALNEVSNYKVIYKTNHIIKQP
jgi:hypothetical protein